VTTSFVDNLMLVNPHIQILTTHRPMICCTGLYKEQQWLLCFGLVCFMLAIYMYFLLPVTYICHCISKLASAIRPAKLYIVSIATISQSVRCALRYRPSCPFLGPTNGCMITARVITVYHCISGWMYCIYQSWFACMFRSFPLSFLYASEDVLEYSRQIHDGIHGKATPSPHSIPQHALFCI
jgi:hypothetical protein